MGFKIEKGGVLLKKGVEKGAKDAETAKITRRFPPARTLEERENQLIALAIDRAEEQLLNGTASSQVITHFLKLGSTKEKLEKDILEKQRELIAAKTENLQSAKRMEELWSDAISALRDYRGEKDRDDEDEE